MIPSLTPITTRCVHVDADLIRSMSEEEWAAYVAGKYPDFDGELGDFTSSENDK